jgi:hypothetical protein
LSLARERREERREDSESSRLVLDNVNVKIGWERVMKRKRKIRRSTS